jgi:hypothetical protein
LRELDDAEYSSRERILVIPGNHDVRWTKGGNDKLNAFKRHIAPMYNTCCGNPDSPFCLPGQHPIGHAVYHYPAYQIAFHCMNSAFYSGTLSDEFIRVREMILETYSSIKSARDSATIRTMLEKIVRDDYPFLPADYVTDILSLYDMNRRKLEGYTVFGVIHHNLDAYAHAPNRKYRAMLHGHIHTTVSQLVHRGDNWCFGLPCGTLSGRSLRSLSFNLIDVNHDRHDALGRPIVNVYELVADDNGMFAWPSSFESLDPLYPEVNYFSASPVTS